MVQTVKELVETIGRKKFTEAGFTPQELTRPMNDNIMPAGWWKVVRRLCYSNGVQVNEDLFRWRPDVTDQTGPSE